MSAQPANASVRIKRPRATVHALLADLERRPRYLDHLVVDWVFADRGTRARARAKGGGSHDELELAILEVTPERVVEEVRGGRGLHRRMVLTYEVREVSAAVTQVEFELVLDESSVVDRACWPLLRTHLERQYGQAMLRLKGLLEGGPR